MSDPNSIKSRLVLLVILLILSGCSGKGVISGRVLVPSPDEGPASDSSVTRTVVFLDAHRSAKGANPGRRAEINQSDDGFEPHVLPVTRGTEVSFRNSGNVFHNVFSVSPVNPFDVGTYPPGETRSVVFDQPGIVNVFCELHPKSAGFVVVLPDHYFAQPDATGAFALPRLPGGKYTVKAWHPIFGETSQDVLLSGRKNVRIRLEF